MSFQESNYHPWTVIALVGTLLVAGAVLSVFTPVLATLRGVVVVAFLCIVPGFLLLNLLEVREMEFGLYLTYGVALSLVSVTLVTVGTGRLLALLGWQRPFGFWTLGVVQSIFIAGLYWLASRRGPQIGIPSSDVPRRTWTLAALCLLPVLAVIGVVLVRRYDSNLGMSLVVLFAGLVAVAAGAGTVDRTQYPALVYSISLATLLQRNLVSGHIVGGDIQALYGTALAVTQSGQLSAATAETVFLLPVVTLVPAVLSELSGLDLVTIYTVVYVALASFVPVGLYYLGREVFDHDISLFGSLFFAFYPVTFLFTPGKQHLAELFVVLVLVTFASDEEGRRQSALLALLSAGLVVSHYAVTYVYGFALLATTLVVTVVARGRNRDQRWFSPLYPAVLLTVATLWYSVTSSALVGTLLSIPPSVVQQLLAVVGSATVEGSGSDYVQTQSTTLEQTQIALYGLLTVLVAVGLGDRALSQARELRDGLLSPCLPHTVLGVMLFGLLGSSYVFTLNLWADRVYQIVLVVLAPFAPYGYTVVAGRVSSPRSGHRDSVSRRQWATVALLLATLFAFSSGFAFALAGDAETSTFDREANDLAFTTAEYEAAVWLSERSDIEPSIAQAPETGARISVDVPERVQIYTDAVGYQLFRGILPPSGYNVETVVLRSRWYPDFSSAKVDSGYVFLRDRSVSDNPSPSGLSTQHRRQLLDMGTVVYENEDVTVVRVEEGAS